MIVEAMYEKQIKYIKYSNSGSELITPKSKETSYIRPTTTANPNVIAIASNWIFFCYSSLVFNKFLCAIIIPIPIAKFINYPILVISNLSHR